MKLILAQYLKTLKERNEFDSLLPDLLLAMGYVPISKAQTGVRQYGVDLAAVGAAPEDGIQELALFVIKRGDIGRTEWDSGPQSVRQSLKRLEHMAVLFRKCICLYKYNLINQFRVLDFACNPILTLVQQVINGKVRTSFSLRVEATEPFHYVSIECCID